MRDVRLDFLRGACLVSMTVGHLMQGTWFDHATHPLRWIDGATGFVLLSGVVVGVVHRRRLAGGGLPSSVRALWARAGEVWLVQCALVVTAVAVRTALGRPDFAPSVSDLGGPARAAVDVMLLRVQPDWFNVLPLYVVLLLVAPAVVAVLDRGWTGLALGGSFVVYTASQVTAGPWTVADVWTPSAPWHWGAWQLLFVGGIAAGWHWDEVVAWGRHNAGMLLTTGFAGLGALAALANSTAVAIKEPLRPPALAMVLLAAGPAYWVAGRLAGSGPGPALVRAGSRTLPAFAALSLLQLAVFTFWPARSLAVSLLLAAGLLGAACLAPSRRPLEPDPGAHQPSAPGDAPVAPAVAAWPGSGPGRT